MKNTRSVTCKHRDMNWNNISQKPKEKDITETDLQDVERMNERKELKLNEKNNVPKTSENSFPSSNLTIKLALTQFIFQPPRPNTLSNYIAKRICFIKLSPQSSEVVHLPSHANSFSFIQCVASVLKRIRDVAIITVIANQYYLNFWQSLFCSHCIQMSDVTNFI